ncbi:hypothetical protein CEXT_544281 [Caerostris extrusa]|uniref:Uncharacterized protein n=1 Tax=Caerostris extrusa TaxID=172846 RepID=A0AAV4QD42_CAEEX|nr:hypothetical protein CEXT_544281 [Caerostris extrusa]
MLSAPNRRDLSTNECATCERIFHLPHCRRSSTADTILKCLEEDCVTTDLDDCARCPRECSRAIKEVLSSNMARWDVLPSSFPDVNYSGHDDFSLVCIRM